MNFMCIFYYIIYKQLIFICIMYVSYIFVVNNLYVCFIDCLCHSLYIYNVNILYLYALYASCACEHAKLLQSCPTL